MSRTEIIPNEAKFKELMLYVASKSSDDPNFGATKLNKLLFIIDHYAYAQLGQPVTGVEYMKLENGPAPRHLVPMRNEMEADKDAIEVEKTFFGRSQKRLIPLRDAHIGSFQPEEIALIDEVIQLFWNATASDMSNLTHRWRGWRVARRVRDAIPYSSFFLSDEPPTEYELARAEELKAKYGWDVR